VVRIGAGTVVVNGTDIVAVDRVDIGERCRIGSRCTIVDSDFHGISPEKRDQAGNTTPVEIGNNVWLGLEVVVLKGVTMGNDSIAGARAVVTQDVPPGGIAVSPAAKIAGSVYVD
jgi:acetyltransferase-like isoleucine patch superfamily enzyme